MSDKLGGRGVTVSRPNEKRPALPSSGSMPGITQVPHDKIPNIAKDPSGRGVSTQSMSDRRPVIQPATGGKGVNAQTVGDHVPKMPYKYGSGGVNVDSGNKKAVIGSGARLLPWFYWLAERLARVVVLNRDWTSAVTPTVLMHTASARKPPVGILLDPPYRTDTGRKSTIYAEEDKATDVATAAYLWAVENGHVYKIAYCCHEGDFEIPDGWTPHTKRFGTQRGNRGSKDMIMFSPACEVKDEA